MDILESRFRLKRMHLNRLVGMHLNRLVGMRLARLVDFCVQLGEDELLLEFLEFLSPFRSGIILWVNFPIINAICSHTVADLFTRLYDKLRWINHHYVMFLQKDIRVALLTLPKPLTRCPVGVQVWNVTLWMSSLSCSIGDRSNLFYGRAIYWGTSQIF